MLIVFHDMIADMESNQKLSPIVTKLLLRRRLNKSVVFISQSYFKVPKTIRLNSIHFTMKILNKKELQQIVSSHLSGIDFKDS